MDRPRAYIESTIPSFYHETRESPAIVARRDWTRQWWEIRGSEYEMVTSEAVLDELADGLPKNAAARLDLVRNLPMLPIDASNWRNRRGVHSPQIDAGGPCGGRAAPGVGLVLQV